LGGGSSKLDYNQKDFQSTRRKHKSFKFNRYDKLPRYNVQNTAGPENENVFKLNIGSTKSLPKGQSFNLKNN
jgi:hypothetical protein